MILRQRKERGFDLLVAHCLQTSFCISDMMCECVDSSETGELSETSSGLVRLVVETKTANKLTW